MDENGKFSGSLIIFKNAKMQKLYGKMGGDGESERADGRVSEVCGFSSI